MPPCEIVFYLHYRTMGFKIKFRSLFTLLRISCFISTSSYLLYYPFIGEQETMPSAAACRAGAQPRKNSSTDRKRRRGGVGADDDLEGLSVSGGVADNTAHVFWMGRYLPRGLGGRDEILKWMKPRKVALILAPV